VIKYAMQVLFSSATVTNNMLGILHDNVKNMTVESSLFFLWHTIARGCH
jgi:hypothetical protein